MTDAWPAVQQSNQLIGSSHWLRLRMVVSVHLLVSRYSVDLLFCGGSKSRVVGLAYAQIFSRSRPDR